jgi:hypothetical protein
MFEMQIDGTGVLFLGKVCSHEESVYESGYRRTTMGEKAMYLLLHRSAGIVEKVAGWACKGQVP